MLEIYRRHNEAKCRSTDPTTCTNKRRPCPIWIRGVQADGTYIRQPLKVRDWTKAARLCMEWEARGEKPKAPTRKTTVEEWRKAFLAVAEANNLSSETIRKYRTLFRQLEAFARPRGIQFVSELDLHRLTEFRLTWKDGALSASKKLERLRSTLGFAQKRKWIADNPASDLESPKVKPNPTLPFSDAEMDAILKAATNQRVRAFILTMRFSGLRASDVTRLSVDSLTGNRLRLYQAKTGEPVSVLLPESVADGLRSIPHPNPQYFFWTGTSKVPAAVSVWRKRLAGVFHDAGVIGGRSHRFRDTFSVGLLQAGVSLEDVSVLLGHQSTKITAKHYAPWVRSRQDALDAAITRANRLQPVQIPAPVRATKRARA